MFKKIKDSLMVFSARVDKKFSTHFGFSIQDTDFAKISNFLHSPRDSSSLAVTRILFGICMLLDIPDERGGANMERRWGDPNICHFPLLPFITAVPMPYMAVVYLFLWLGALGITLGYKFRLSAVTFAVCYWYLFLIEKSFWNNHSYLFGLVALLLIGTDANCYWSLDVYLNPQKRSETVPYWNYFVLKYQFFILYFVAGLKKGTAEWLSGFSLLNLAEHWVFSPFKLFLTVPQIDYLIVHWFAFIFDLTIAFWMMWARTRHVAMLFCAAFHLMNIRLFRIGMFPWVCLATMPLFYPFDWPKKTTNLSYETFKIYGNKKQKESTESTEKNPANEDKKPNFQRKSITFAIILYMAIQAFLPYSHFITKGYNDWTNGLYGYSWDMMVHSWAPHAVVVKIIENDSQKEMFLDPYKFTVNERWIRHGNMIYQFAQCIKHNFIDNFAQTYGESNNISIFFDIWCSMNGRFQQRMYDSNEDLLKTQWHPLEKISWLMPLLDETSQWRSRSMEIESEVYKWSNHTNVIFIADFPGYAKEVYLEPDLINVTLTILDGQVAYEPELTSKIGQSYRLNAPDHLRIQSGIVHTVTTLGDTPAYYMYTYINETEALKPIKSQIKSKPMLPVGKELSSRLTNMLKFLNIVFKSLFQLLFRV